MAESGTRPDEPERFPRQGSMSSKQDLIQWENTSVETCTILSWLGYGQEIIQARRDAYREFGKLLTARTCGTTTCIITGSKGEGLSSFLESDQDQMIVNNRVFCLEDDVKSCAFPGEITVLRSLSRKSYHGHCRLLLERRGTTIHRQLNDAFCDDGYGRELLSSDLFVNNWSNERLAEGMVQHERAGPSIPSTMHGHFHNDKVHALHYYCPNILSKWAARPRHWPPPEVAQRVVSLGAVLTPVGFKGSEYQHVEWRVCFNAGEIELISNLNDTQTKLYVLLKMIKNDVLHPRKKEVTSYTLKNIVLWMAENNPQASFHKKSILQWLHEALDALRVALITLELPYYMIPERNLMATSGLDEEQQRTWISTITDMLNEGPRVILRLPKIRQCIVAHPEPLRWYSGRRIEVEMLTLMLMNRVVICRDENGEYDITDAILQALIRRGNEVITDVCERMIMEGSRVFNADATIFDRIMM
ncbi:uncharacterized protein LOC127867092 isoform X1 [Dreissena polymorpha]|uniref:Mab-21-like HhH/H2TH-like domain-containing protein n=1 Tax=Dreissena polymorpha TaxID=45954 RepID=A0A9D4LX09_DREPO|nr:uncharacterized protein LOC127867092 isoform X1 [Dreissena polymorpha]XP_052264028.1 uncharacterized protein LOC127867092 isoform X1 [Dreissena polymorpha]XP_052264029.1 uncharacterized protein LOC127867092 isoform X1 [Dreissena polymorpha]XP_052264030.1 uncharacterized protein LOC127867092 isoform X1 [Dreissena polymorpha]XP_052264031.1 uncharacterized protein LOC127867092 isoform X1 [Dreissena polymorpha]XP_052264032.1 uncharacterized protein LOC127867092 isoform X1 [Dreissena polymorpha]